jgi:hypothetical protein
VDLTTISRTITALLASLGAIVGFSSKASIVRGRVRANLALLRELDEDDALRQESLAATWLRDKIIVDVARLSKHPLGKRRIPWRRVFWYVVFASSLASWTYDLDRNSYTWHSLIPGIMALLFALAASGTLIDRDIPPKTDDSSSINGALPTYEAAIPPPRITTDAT